MLKYTSIISSFVFLLFTVTGSYARTLETSAVQEASKQDKQENDSDTNSDNKPVASVVHLDVLQVISLVNSQLRWKDFHAENSRSSRFIAESNKDKADQHQTEETSELFNGSLNVAVINQEKIEWIVACWPSVDTAVQTSAGNPILQQSTVAYILNCGTYPQHLS